MRQTVRAPVELAVREPPGRALGHVHHRQRLGPIALAALHPIADEHRFHGLIRRPGIVSDEVADYPWSEVNSTSTRKPPSPSLRRRRKTSPIHPAADHCLARWHRPAPWVCKRSRYSPTYPSPNAFWPAAAPAPPWFARLCAG